MENKELAKKFLGEELYNNLRSRKMFNDLSHPFPMQQVNHPEIDWDTYLPYNGAATNMLYVVSPTQRSGTNFLSHILSYHPSLEFPKGESMPNEHCLFSAAPKLVEYVEETLSYWSKWINDTTILENHAKGLMSSMGEGISKHLEASIGMDRMLLLKTPDAGGIKYFFHMFPAAKLVILIRDGRDTVQSFSKSWGGHGAFRKMAARWAERVDQLYNMQDQATAAGYSNRILWVQYDQLNNETETEMKRILDFAGLDEKQFPWDQLKNTPVLGSSEFKAAGHVHWNPVEKTESFKPVNKWQSWTKKQRDTFKEYAGEALIRSGFAQDLNW